MLPYLFIVAGAILVVAGPSWFSGAVAVGSILIVAGVILILVGLVSYFVAKRAMKKMSQRAGRFFDF